MSGILAKFSISLATLLWLIAMSLLVSSCTSQGTWYQPRSSEGYAENGQCGTSGRENEWVLNRQGVKFSVTRLTPVAVSPPGVAVVVSVPANIFVEMSVKDIRVKAPDGRELQGEKSLVAIGRENSKIVKNEISIDTQVLYGSKLSSKRYPTTDYFFNLRLQDSLPDFFSVVLPYMEINGYEYPPLTIHFTKKTDTYFVLGINC